MASEKKWKKLENSHYDRGSMKDKTYRCKRWFFFTPSRRYDLNKKAFRGEEIAYQ